jgi:pantoate kinase
MLFEKGSVDAVSVVVSDVSVVVVTVVVSEVVVSEVSVVELSVGMLSSGSVLQDDTDAHKAAVSNKLTAFLANPFPNKFFFI